MSATKLSGRYAKSLLDLAIEQNSLQSIVADMQLLKDALTESYELRLLLKSPIINPDRKQKILDKVFAGKIGEVTHEFIKILVRKGREAYLADISIAFTEQYNVHMHITPVKITSAAELDKRVLDELVAKIKKDAGIRQLELTTAVNTDLVGGFVIQYEDKMYDASVVKELDALKKEYSGKEYEKQF